MPVPKPRTGEKENEYISRCMGAIGGEENAIGICYGQWNQSRGLPGAALAVDARRILQVPVRAVEDKPHRVLSYAAIWGDEEHKDLYETWFTPDTNFCLDWYDKRPYIYDHGFNQFVRAAKIGEWKDTGLDEKGLFFLGELDAHFHYLDELEFLMSLGYLFPSSGTMSHLMSVADDGWIAQWPIAELSSTAAPAEWRIPPQVGARDRKRAALALRTLLGGLTMPDSVAGALFPGVDLETPPEQPVDSDVRDVETADDVHGTEVDLEATDTPAPGELEVEAEETEVEVQEPEDGVTDVSFIVTAIQHLDHTLQGVAERQDSILGRLEALETRSQEPVAARVAHLVDNPTWVSSLWSATRSGRALRQQDVGGQGDDALGQDSPVLQQLGTIGGTSVDPTNILGSILASQQAS